MRITVCELHDEREWFEQDWERLVQHVKSESSDLVLLPEFPFSEWFPATDNFNITVWESAVAAHDAGVRRLGALSPARVLGTRPVSHGGKRFSEGFVWSESDGYRASHLKYYVPDVDGAWEASWFEQGDGDFSSVDVGPARVGFLICSELWATELARDYGSAGVHVIASPRATEVFSLDKFLAGGRVVSVVSGTFALSSNRVSLKGNEVNFGGQGWIIGPNGDVLGMTSSKRPFLTLDVDLREADRAKTTYPRDMFAACGHARTGT
jgi:N-carbamoylputrescine amidase